MFDFSLSTSTKFSMVVTAAALLLFGAGYIIQSTTGLIDEIDKKDKKNGVDVDENVKKDEVNVNTSNTPN